MEWLTFTASPGELILRATIVYWSLFLLFRFVLRRDISGAGMSDFLFVVIVGDAVQNAMLGEHFAVADGLTVVGTLAFWNLFFDFFTARFRWFERFASSQRTSLCRDGKLNWRSLRRELVSEEELRSKLHAAGYESFDEVKEIFLESDGEIAVIEKKR